MPMHPVVAEVTARIIARSQDSRAAYLAQIDAASRSGPGRAKLSCANFAHAFAAMPDDDKTRMRNPMAPNLGIVTAYNELGRAHVCTPLTRTPRMPPLARNT